MLDNTHSSRLTTGLSKSFRRMFSGSKALVSGRAYLAEAFHEVTRRSKQDGAGVLLLGLMETRMAPISASSYARVAL